MSGCQVIQTIRKKLQACTFDLLHDHGTRGTASWTATAQCMYSELDGDFDLLLLQSVTGLWWLHLATVWSDSYRPERATHVHAPVLRRSTGGSTCHRDKLRMHTPQGARLGGGRACAHECASDSDL